MKKIFFQFTAILSIGHMMSQELLYDSGLYYEKPITNDTSQNRYSLDNISYKKNMVFLYELIITKTSQERKRNS